MASPLLAYPVATILAASQVRDLADRDGENAVQGFALLLLLLMVIFGGIGHIWGGVIGAIAVTIINDLTQDFYIYRMLIFGAIIVLTVMYMPRGIGGYIDDFFVRRRFAELRAKTAASLRQEAQ